MALMRPGAMLVCTAVIGSCSVGVWAADPPNAVHILDLPVAGETVLVFPPGNDGWGALEHDGQDIVVHPDKPEINIRLLPGKGPCDRILARIRFRGGQRTVRAPAYLPPNFFPAAIEGSFQGIHLAAACADLQEGKHLLCQVASHASLVAAEVAEPLRGMLESLGRTFGAKQAPAQTARPANPNNPLGALTEATGAPATGGQTGNATTAATTAAAPTGSATAAPTAATVAAPEPSPPPPPPPDESDDDDFDFSAGLREPSLLNVEARVGYMAPAGFDKVVGATLQFEGGPFVASERDDLFAFCVGYGAAIGVNSDGNVPFDAQLGVGPGLRLGPVTLAPLIGLGMDTMGAGGDYDMAAAFYWYPQGRLRLGLGPVGLDGVVSRTFRGSVEADVATDVPNQTRVDARLYFHQLADDYDPYVGFHWTEMRRLDEAVGVDVAANYLGGMIGLGVPSDD